VLVVLMLFFSICFQSFLALMGLWIGSVFLLHFDDTPGTYASSTSGEGE
jgi:hypothetical protein